jgi:hypothetical protein
MSAAALMTRPAVALSRTRTPVRSLTRALQPEVMPLDGGRVPLPSEPLPFGGDLFTVTRRGAVFIVGHATTEELAALEESEDPTAKVQDVVELWSLIAVRDQAGRRTDIHALGWRAHLQSTWITPPLVGVNLNRCQVTTVSGHSFRLLEQDAPGLEPRLRSHLADALLGRGFTYV